MQDYIERKTDINVRMEGITVKQFDNNSRYLHVKINDKDASDGLFNMTGCSTALYIQREGNADASAVAFVPGEVSEDDDGGGIVTFLLPGSVTQKTGRYECEIWIYEGSDTNRPIISTKPFLLTVEKSIRNTEAIEATDEYSALDAALITVQGLRNRISELVASPAGSGGDVGTELRDIRVGADGTEYNSAGDAVRTQLGKKLSNSVTDVAAGTDFNDITQSGCYKFVYAGSYPNSPIATGRRYMIVLSQNTSTSPKSQILFDVDTGDVYTRGFYDGGWGSWVNRITSAESRISQLEADRPFYDGLFMTQNDLSAMLERDMVYSKLTTLHLSHGASASVIDKRTIVDENIPVTGGEYMYFTQECRSLDYPDLYTGLNFRVYQYDGGGNILASTTTSAKTGRILLNSGTKTVTVAVNTVVTAHETALVNRVLFHAVIYTNPRLNSDIDINAKRIAGSNPHRKALDHGGFFSKTLYQNSPLSFLTAAKEGIMYHNLDIVFSSDNVPFVIHDDTLTDTGGVTFKISETTAANVKTHTLGDSAYSWVPQTLAETHRYIKTLGGVIDMVDVSASPNLTNAQTLPAYYRAHNIKPAYTNWDSETLRNAFIQNGSEFGVYMVCQNAAAIGTAIAYIRQHSGTDFAVNVLCSSQTRLDDIAATDYISQLAALGVTVYGYQFEESNYHLVPEWLDGVLSEGSNVNYLLWKDAISE